MRTLDPESARPYSSSAPVHHVLSGTAMAPSETMAKKAAGHSGRLAMAIATRSPLATPSRPSWAERAAVARKEASKPTRSPSQTVKSRSPWPRE
jgi:hypothetical protein